MTRSRLPKFDRLVETGGGGGLGHPDPSGRADVDDDEDGSRDDDAARHSGSLLNLAGFFKWSV